jgi:Na+-transporting NADH:ubiquinone oxidoreductase subunit NqrA
MLSSPSQNAEVLHRAEIVSEQRSADSLRTTAEQQGALAAARRREERHLHEIEATTETELDPDAHQEEEPYRGKQRKRKSRQGKPDTSAPPIRNLGAGHIDLTA